LTKDFTAGDVKLSEKKAVERVLDGLGIQIAVGKGDNQHGTLNPVLAKA